jgi:AraC family transcriptional regulator
MKLPLSYHRHKKLDTLVENKTTYTLQSAEMNIFETHQAAEQVLLGFQQPVLATMIKGKKIMHLEKETAFSFLPGESLLMPSDALMCIDFPEATHFNPTQCLAMTISEEIIANILELMNMQYPKTEGIAWQFSQQNFHFSNDAAIQQIIHRLIFLFAENHPTKDMFVDMMLKELLVRIMQTESRQQLLQNTPTQQTQNRIAFIVDYIRQNIREKLTIKQLSQKTYMSESHFYRFFKNELGISPVEFINNERIQLAAQLLQGGNQQKIQEISENCGFNSLSYFNRVFKHKYALSPSAYQHKFSEGKF